MRDLTERRPIAVSLCTEGGRVPLERGTHTVEAGDTGPLAVTRVDLKAGEPRAAATAPRTVEAVSGGGDRRVLRVGAGEAAYLQLHENHNAGWKAELDGRELRPLRVDGWQQAWLVPAGAGGSVTLVYEPSRLYDTGLAVAGALLVLLAGLAFVGRRGRSVPVESGAEAEPPGPGLLLGTVVPTLVGVVIAGPLALVVPVLAVVARLRPAVLGPLALAAMTGAGIAALTGSGEPTALGRGAYGATAQVLALVALFAALVTVRGERTARTGAHRVGTAPRPPSGEREEREAPGPAGRDAGGPWPPGRPGRPGEGGR